MPETSIGLKTCEEDDNIYNEPIEACEFLLSLRKLNLFHPEEEAIQGKEKLKDVDIK